MMRRSLMLTVLLGALLAGPPVQAQQPSLLNRLERYCAATKGDSAAALRTARADGFVTPPRELIPDLPRDIDDVEVLWTVFEGGVVMLMTGTSNDRSTGMTGDFCAVASMPQNQAAVKDLEGWLGAKLPGAEGYVMFSEEGKERKVIPQNDQRALLAAVRDERLRMAGARSDRQMTLLMLVALRL
jgi:hypothetical protein